MRRRITLPDADRRHGRRLPVRRRGTRRPHTATSPHPPAARPTAPAARSPTAATSSTSRRASRRPRARPSATAAAAASPSSTTTARTGRSPRSARSVTFNWVLTARHSTSTWEYFIGGTRLASFNDGGAQPGATKSHTVSMGGFSGRQTVLARWNIADTVNAFYSCVDVNIGGGGSHPAADHPAPDQPAAPRRPPRRRPPRRRRPAAPGRPARRTRSATSSPTAARRTAAGRRTPRWPAGNRRTSRPCGPGSSTPVPQRAGPRPPAWIRPASSPEEIVCAACCSRCC